MLDVAEQGSCADWRTAHGGSVPGLSVVRDNRRGKSRNFHDNDSIQEMRVRRDTNSAGVASGTGEGRLARKAHAVRGLHPGIELRRAVAAATFPRAVGVGASRSSVARSMISKQEKITVKSISLLIQSGRSGNMIVVIAQPQSQPVRPVSGSLDFGREIRNHP
jgi:hypothetical protein